MAPSPTIPTSFVPKQPVKSAARFTRGGGNIFMMLALIIAGIALAGAGAVFLYQQYLMGVLASKEAQVKQERESIQPQLVEDFVRFRDRFAAAKDILGAHVAASHFFDLLEKETLVSVRFSSLTFEHVDDGSAKITLSGAAKSFNALAAQSAQFTGEKFMKRAIFSDIKVDPASGAVTFTLTADLDKTLIAFTLLDDGSAGQPEWTGETPPPGTTLPGAGVRGSSTPPSTSAAPTGTPNTTPSAPPASTTTKQP